MFCIHCGNPNPDIAAFCQHCGAPIPKPLTKKVPPPAPAQIPPSQKPLQKTPPPAPAQIPPSQKPLQKAPPAKVQAPPKPKKVRTAPPKASVGTRILSICLCICFIVSFLLAGFAGLGRKLLQRDTVSDIVAEINFDNIVITDDGIPVSLPIYIYNNLDADAQEIFSIRVIRNALMDYRVRQFAVDIILGYAEFFTEDKQMQHIKAKEIADFIDDNINTLSEGEVKYLSSSDYNKLLDELERYYIFDTLTYAELYQTLGVGLPLLQFFLSPLCYWLCIACCIIFLALIVLVNRKNLCVCFSRLSTNFIVLGGLGLFLALACLIPPCFVSTGILKLMSPIFIHIAVFCALRGGITFVIGLGGCILSKILRKKDKASVAHAKTLS